MARFILVPVGSSGDVHPLLGLGSQLHRRGHDVTIFTNGVFEHLVKKLNLNFRPLGTVEEFYEVSGNPDLWHPFKGFKMVAQWAIVATMEPIYEGLKQLYVPGETVVAAPATAFGARIAHEKLGVPLVTIHLQPAVFRSVIQSPVLPPLLIGDRIPRFLKRSQFYLADRLIVDLTVARQTNAFRSRLDLPPVKRVLDKWWNSPQRILGLFPDWYAPQQPDWPAQTRLTGFPLWDESETTEIPAGVASFLQAGSPPLVFTPGSAMRHGTDFFKVAVETCQRLNRRGMFLTRFPEQLPQYLPDGIEHFEYIPFSAVLPAAAALIHHGGIGSTAQALAAGIPQFIMAMAHDQPDNLARIQRLGVGTGVRTRQFRTERVVSMLGKLLDSRDVADRCASVKQKFATSQPLDPAVDEIEKLVGCDVNR